MPSSKPSESVASTSPDISTESAGISTVSGDISTESAGISTVSGDISTESAGISTVSGGISSVSLSTSAWVVLALTAASIEPILIKLGFQAQATPLQLLVLKNLVAAGVMLILVRGWKRPASVSMLGLITVSLLLFSTNAFCLFALTKLSAVELITIITSTPAAVALVNCLRKRDSRGRLFWFGLAASLAGVFVSLQVNPAQTLLGAGIGATGAVATASGLNVVGVIFALAAVLSSTTYRIKIETILRQADPRLVSLNIFVINAIVSLFLVPWLGPVNVSILPFIVWMGMAAALANLAFIASVKQLGATRMSVINLIQRPMIIVIAAVVLKEALGWPQVLGFVLVMIGVQMAQVKPAATPGAATNAEKPAAETELDLVENDQAKQFSVTAK